MEAKDSLYDLILQVILAAVTNKEYITNILF